MKICQNLHDIDQYLFLLHYIVNVQSKQLIHSVELKKIFLLYSYIDKISKNDRSKRRDKETNNDLHRKLNIEHHKPHRKPGVNSGAPEGKTVSSPLVVPSFYSSYTNPMITCEWERYWEVLTASGTYPWLFVTQTFRNG